MGENSKIEWTDHTFNPWVGCTQVSPACDNCYAANGIFAKFNGVEWGKDTPRHLTGDDNWKKPVRWNKRGAHATKDKDNDQAKDEAKSGMNRPGCTGRCNTRAKSLPHIRLSF